MMTEINRRAGTQDPQLLTATRSVATRTSELGLAESLPLPASDTAATFETRAPVTVEPASALKQGSAGPDVAAIQEQLKSFGYPLYMTGKFDKATAAALAG